MNYVSALNKEELEILCGIVSGKEFKVLYQHKYSEFAKIRPGFRPTSISEADALKLAIRNINQLFIYTFINDYVDNILKKIQADIDDRVILNEDETKATAVALSESIFAEEVELYFKLANKEIDSSSLEEIKNYILQNKLSVISAKEKLLPEKSDEIVNLEELNELKEQIRTLTEQLQDETNLHISQINTLCEERDGFKNKLQDVQQALTGLQREYNEAEAELTDLRARAQYEDIQENIEEINETKYNHSSLCEVGYLDGQGNQVAIRLADIIDSRLVPFYVDEHCSKQFENRYKIYIKDGPNEPGIVGIWKWKAEQNMVDSSRDYVFSAFEPNISPIEVIQIEDCITSEELLEVMKRGIEFEINTLRVMFVAYVSKGQYIGFLCKSKDIEQRGSFIKISQRVISLPRYEFSGKEITHLSNGKMYYRSVRIGMPVEVVNVKNPLDIVRTIILSRSTWSVFKEKGKTRSEWKDITDLLKTMDNKSIIDSIIDEANCSKKEAQKMLNDFIENAIDYIGGTTIEDKIISAVVSVNTDLMDRCKALIKEDWTAENKKMVDDANAELVDLQNRIKDTRAKFDKEVIESNNRIRKQMKEAEISLADVQHEHDVLQESLQALTDDIEAKEKLAADVEESVKKRISQAQKNVADFIAGFAFISPISEEKYNSKSINQTEFVTMNEPDESTVGYTVGTDILSESLEENESWQDTLDTIAEELKEAGVVNKLVHPLAAYLYSAYLNKYPLLMIGPNASAIVDAFSASVFGKTAGVLECNDKYSIKSLNACLSSDDEVVRIVNPFSSSWASRIPDIVGNKSKYFIAVYPYLEDIQIEPKSLYSYMLPVFTDLLVDKEPSGQVIGGIQSENYSEFKAHKYKIRHNKIFSDMHTSLLVRTRIKNVLSYMHLMIDDQNVDYDMLFTFLPFAYATNQMSTLFNSIENGNEVSKDTIALVNEIFGKDE